MLKCSIFLANTVWMVGRHRVPGRLFCGGAAERSTVGGDPELASHERLPTRLVQEGKSSAGLVREATRKLDTYLSICQLGITIASLGLGWIGEPAFAHLIEPLLAPLGIPEGTVHVVAFAAAFGIITFLHVVFGELAPKSLAIARAEGTSLFMAPS